MGGEDDYVERVVVVPERAGYEAVVEREVLRGMSHPVQGDEPGLLVYLVFILRTLVNLDDDVDGVFRAGFYVVPEVHGVNDLMANVQ